MPDRDFCLWLQGFFELTGATEITPAQTKMIKEHLALVFNKVTSELDTLVPDLSKVEWPEPLGWPKPHLPGQIQDFDHLSRPTIIC